MPAAQKERIRIRWLGPSMLLDERQPNARSGNMKAFVRLGLLAQQRRVPRGIKRLVSGL